MLLSIRILDFQIGIIDISYIKIGMWSYESLDIEIQINIHKVSIILNILNKQQGIYLIVQAYFHDLSGASKQGMMKIQ